MGGVGQRKDSMRRRDFLKAVGVGTAALVLARSARPASTRKPNIILIMADDLGYGDIGCYGSETIRTPNIDALAAGGMKFTDYHSNCPVCSPTRAALLTGRYQQRTGIEGVVTAARHRDKGLPLAETTFAEVLKSAGYTTAIFGKWHVGYDPRFNPVKQGFDAFRGYVSGNVDYHSHIDQEGYEDWWTDDRPVPEEGYVTDLITQHGLRFIEQNRSWPFCLYLPHEAPHFPYQGREDNADRTIGQGKPIHGTRQDKAGGYREMIEVMDEGIGRIVGTAKRLGLERDTFIFFCSDNGATAVGSNGPLRGGKGSLWEGGHRVPAIAYWPGKIEPGSVTGETVLGMDLFPTIAAIAGAALPAGLILDGVDLRPVILEGKRLPERTLFWRYDGKTAIRKGPWKLLVNQPAEDNETQPPVRLFKLDEDLEERNNLADAQPERAKALRAELAAWEAEVSAGVERQT